MEITMEKGCYKEIIEEGEKYKKGKTGKKAST